jgi:glycosyltransferase involved in cell wall biosynthesis
VVLIAHPSNQGLSAARNTGLAAVRSPWIIFVDSDDVVSPELCAAPLLAAQSQGADAVFFGIVQFEDGTPLSPLSPIGDIRLATRNELLAQKSYACTKLLRTDFLRERGILFPPGLCMQDVPVHWRIVLESVKPVLLERALVWYRQRPNSISYRVNWTRADGFLVYDIVREYLQKAGLWEQWAQLFVINELNIFADIYFNFSGRDSRLAKRATAEARRRMTTLHWQVALSGSGLVAVKRDYLLAECRPKKCQSSLLQVLPILRHLLRSLFRRPWRALRQVIRRKVQTQ